MDIFKHWLVLALVITSFCGLVYLAGQQNYRQSANDPQIQMAEDGAVKMQLGQTPDGLNTNLVDLNSSLAPFIITFNSSGQPVMSNSVLDGRIPTPPPGVFDYVKNHGEDRFTWEPKPGVRIAAVVTRFAGKSSGFILAGRSLREVEIREDRLEQHVAAVWLLTLFASFVYLLISKKLLK